MDDNLTHKSLFVVDSHGAYTLIITKSSAERIIVPLFTSTFPYVMEDQTLTQEESHTVTNPQKPLPKVGKNSRKEYHPQIDLLTSHQQHLILIPECTTQKDVCLKLASAPPPSSHHHLTPSHCMTISSSEPTPTLPPPHHKLISTVTHLSHSPELPRSPPHHHQPPSNLFFPPSLIN